MLQWSDITRWTTGDLEDTSFRLRKVREKLIEISDNLAKTSRNLLSEGGTADASRTALDTQQNALVAHITDISELMMATSEAIDSVADIRSLVQDCIDYAEMNDVIIGEDGTTKLVELPREGNYDPYLNPEGMFPPNHGQDNIVFQKITYILLAAEEVDNQYVRRLQAITDDTYSSAALSSQPKQSSIGLANEPQPNWSPTEVASWWNALNTDERKTITEKHPDWIGNLDGIDGFSRDKANRMRLESMIADAEADVEKRLADSINKGSLTDTETLPRANALREARARLADLELLRDTIEEDQQLLVLDNSGERLKTAVVVGNVDTADHVAVFIPGNGTTVTKSLKGHIQSIRDLRIEAAIQAETTTGNVATIAWLGYDTPQTDPSLFTVGKAQEGADRLVPFLEGIHASHIASGQGDPYLTGTGHSYGSTTLGIALTQVNEGVVDAAILAGSPGAGVQDILEYRLEAGDAYVSGVPSGDGIVGLGADGIFGKNPMTLNGFTHLSNDIGDISDESVIDKLNPIRNHSIYMQSGTEAFTDIARVVGDAK